VKLITDPWQGALVINKLNKSLEMSGIIYRVDVYHTRWGSNPRPSDLSFIDRFLLGEKSVKNVKIYFENFVFLSKNNA